MAPSGMNDYAKPPLPPDVTGQQQPPIARYAQSQAQQVGAGPARIGRAHV